MASKVSNGGSYDANFVEDVPEFLQCIVCHLALRKPVQLIDCGHKFCECCFEKLKLHSISSALDLLCPLDRTLIEPSKVFPDKGIERVVFDLKVNCDNKDQGCGWSGDLRSLKIHLNTDCLFAMDSCIHDGCDVKMERGKLKEHMKVCLKNGNVSERLWKIVTTLTQRMDNYEAEMRKKDNKIEECNKQIQEKEILLQIYNKDLEETKNDLKQVQERLENISKDSIKCLNCVEQLEIVLNANKDSAERNFKEEVKKFDKQLNCVVEEMKQLREERLENKVEYQIGYVPNKRYEEELRKYTYDLHNNLDYLNKVCRPEQCKWLICDYAVESLKGKTLYSHSIYSGYVDEKRGIDRFHYKFCVKWYGEMQESLCLFIFLTPNRQTIDRAAVKGKVNFNFQNVSKDVLLTRVNESDFNKKQGFWQIKGFGCFLEMPNLQECIIDDTLFISFVLLVDD